MRRTGQALALLIALFLIGTSPAAAYVDVGYDPEGDSTSETGAYDIRSSVRSVVHGPHGRFLRLALRLDDADLRLGSWVYVDARLDARGGRAADAVLHMWILDMSGSGCQLESRSGRMLKKGILILIDESTEDGAYFGMACRAHVHPLRPTKPIRWTVTTLYGNGKPLFDTAPNAGMYG